MTLKSPTIIAELSIFIITTVSVCFTHFIFLRQGLEMQCRLDLSSLRWQCHMVGAKGQLTLEVGPELSTQGRTSFTLSHHPLVRTGQGPRWSTVTLPKAGSLAGGPIFFQSHTATRGLSFNPGPLDTCSDHTEGIAVYLADWWSCPDVWYCSLSLITDLDLKSVLFVVSIVSPTFLVTHVPRFCFQSRYVYESKVVCCR